MYLQCWFGEAAYVGQDVMSWGSLKTKVFSTGTDHLPGYLPTVECMILGDLNWHRRALLIHVLPMDRATGSDLFSI